jgi:hypothetical protein
VALRFVEQGSGRRLTEREVGDLIEHRRLPADPGGTA